MNKIVLVLLKTFHSLPQRIFVVSVLCVVIGVTLNVGLCTGYIDRDIFSGGLFHGTPILVSLGSALIIFCFLFAAAKALTPERKSSHWDGSPGQIKETAIAYIRTHRNWYARWSALYGRVWNSLTCGMIALSALSSILSASSADKLYATITAALSALFGTILVQYRVRDMWQLREQGRIDAEKLVAKAQLISTSDPATTLIEAVSLRMAVHELENDQNKRYFGVPLASQISSEKSNDNTPDESKPASTS